MFWHQQNGRSIMKKTVLSVLIIFLVCFSFVSCDEDKETNESNNSANETQQIATIKGEAFETEDFSVTIADGFSKMTIEGGVQAYKGNDVIEIWVRGSNVPESEAKNATEQLSKANDGTEPQKTEKFGMDFYYTSFEAFGNPQT